MHIEIFYGLFAQRSKCFFFVSSHKNFNFKDKRKTKDLGQFLSQICASVPSLGVEWQIHARVKKICWFSGKWVT